jgi:hypothetical protein
MAAWPPVRPRCCTKLASEIAFYVNGIGWYFLVATYTGILCAVAFYGLHRYILVYLYCKHRHNTTSPRAPSSSCRASPCSFPMFNEDWWPSASSSATCLLDYPLDRLEIQVLDDSTDHSADIARRACEEWAAKGYPIKYIHRDNRVGYKAGALAAGLKEASGEFIAIFDADFIPPRDILQNVVNYFKDDKVGMVQVRWDHLNRDASLLTKSQAIFLDGTSSSSTPRETVPADSCTSTARPASGAAPPSTMPAAGSTTRSPKISISAIAPIEGLAVRLSPAVLRPGRAAAGDGRLQAAGPPLDQGLGFQTAIKLLPGILRASISPSASSCEAFFHLTNTIVYPLMVIAHRADVPDVFLHEQPVQDLSLEPAHLQRSLFILATVLRQHLLRLRPARAVRQGSRLEIAALHAGPHGPGRRRKPQQRQGRVRGHLERDPPQAQ